MSDSETKAFDRTKQFKIRWTGEALREDVGAVTANDLAKSLIAMQQLVYNAKRSELGRLGTQQSLTYSEMQSVQLQVGERNRESDAFMLAVVGGVATTAIYDGLKFFGKRHIAPLFERGKKLGDKKFVIEATKKIEAAVSEADLNDVENFVDKRKEYVEELAYEYSANRMMNRLEELEENQRIHSSAAWSTIDALSKRVNGLGEVESIEISRPERVESDSEEPIVIDWDTHEVSRRLAKLNYKGSFQSVVATDLRRMDFVNNHIAAKVNGYVTKIKIQPDMVEEFRYDRPTEVYELFGRPINKLGETESRIREFACEDFRRNPLRLVA